MDAPASALTTPRSKQRFLHSFDRRGAIAGLLASVVGLLVGGLVARIGDWNAPVVSVGNRVVDRVPLGVREWAISTFGTDDKAFLKIVITLVVIIAAVVAGSRAVRNFTWAIGAAAVLAVAGVAAAAFGRDAAVGDAVPVLVTAGSALAALWLMLVVPARRTSAEVPSTGSANTGPATTGSLPGVRNVEPIPTTRADVAIDRRGFLRAAGLVSGAGAVSLVATKALAPDATPAVANLGSRVLTGGTTDVAAGAFPKAAVPLPPVNPAAQVKVPGMTPFVVPNGDYYRIDTALVVPRVDVKDWKLEVGGLVETARTYTFEELLDRKLVEADVTLMCVSNEIGGDLIGNARWLGVPLAEILDEVKPAADADQLASWSKDGWSCGFPTALARDGRNALLAIGMNGEPLPRAHGFPARLVIPGIYGYVSATKWITRIELTRMSDFDGYWIPRGWGKLGPIKTGSRIDVPKSRADIAAGPTAIAGIAWAQHRGITMVEVQVDEGPWQKAELAADGGIDTWRQWQTKWTATPGRHLIRVRATDTTGETQTSQIADVAPDGATGWHTISVDVI